jgi:cell fate (sporulation/competence/biofilm development) regulator YlbF (YheA/YmcA/DUF963 family)
MSLVLDKAQELAEAISDSDELATLRTAAEQVDTDEAATGALKKFQEKQETIQMAARSGLELPPEQMAEMQTLQGQIREIPSIQNFAEAQGQFNALIDQVNDIIAGAVMGIVPGATQADPHEHGPGCSCGH